VPVDWAEAQDVPVDPNDLERNPASTAEFAPLPPAAAQQELRQLAEGLHQRHLRLA